MQFRLLSGLSLHPYAIADLRGQGLEVYGDVCLRIVKLIESVVLDWYSRHLET